MKVYVCEETIDYEGIFSYKLFHKEEDARKEMELQIFEPSLKAPKYKDRDNTYKLGRRFPCVGGDISVLEVEVK